MKQIKERINVASSSNSFDPTNAKKQKMQAIVEKRNLIMVFLFTPSAFIINIALNK